MTLCGEKVQASSFGSRVIEIIFMVRFKTVVTSPKGIFCVANRWVNSFPSFSAAWDLCRQTVRKKLVRTFGRVLGRRIKQTLEIVPTMMKKNLPSAPCPSVSFRRRVNFYRSVSFPFYVSEVSCYPRTWWQRWFNSSFLRAHFTLLSQPRWASSSKLTSKTCLSD